MKKTFILFSFSLCLAFTAIANNGTAPLNDDKGEKVETTQVTVKAKLATQVIKESILPLDVVEELTAGETNPAFILDYSISGKKKHKKCKNGKGGCAPKT